MTMESVFLKYYTLALVLIQELFYFNTLFKQIINNTTLSLNICY